MWSGQNNMTTTSFTNNPQINLMDKALKRAASAFRRHFGTLERAQVKGDAVEADAMAARADIAAVCKKELDAGGVPVLSADTKAGDLPQNSAYFLVAPVTSWSNFVHGREPVGMMAVYVNAAGVAESALVYYPLTDITFTTVKSDGAQNNNLRLRAAGRKELKHVLVSANGRDKKMLLSFTDRLNVNETAVHFVSHNDVVADILDVAAGRSDLLVAAGINSGEAALASVLLREAGVYATTMAGDALTPFSNHVLAGNATLHKLASKLML